MKRTMKQRMIALVCIVCMLCITGNTVIPNTSMTAQASTSTATTIHDLLEEGFTPWTFSDVGIGDQTITGDLNKTTATQSSLDKTIFHGKIMFPEGSGDDFGHFYIGGSSYDDDSKWTGIRITGWASSALRIDVTDENGDVIAGNNIWQQSTYNNLRGNSELQLAISVEYLNVTKDGLATIKVGVFVDGVLHLGNYYTFNNVPEQCLTKHVKWLSPSGNPAIKSDDLSDDGIIMWDETEVKDYEEWTFEDVGVADKTAFTGNVNWQRPVADVATLDKTVFTGKILFPSGTGNDIGNFYIGGSSDTSHSVYSGFLIRGVSDVAISLAIAGTDGSVTHNIANLYSSTAGTNLRGNSELQLMLSVEYLTEPNTSGNVNLKVGIFFDGKLYNNNFYTVNDVPVACLTQHAKWYGAANSTTIASDRNKNITLDNAPEKAYSGWTFSDLGKEDNVTNWDNTTAISDSLDGTLFRGKINFSDGGLIMIGGTGDTTTDDGTKYRGIRLEKSGTGVSMSFMGTGGRFFTAEGDTGSGSLTSLVLCDDQVAGATLTGNPDLEVAVSVKYLNTTSDITDLKIGLFFNGKLYNNHYYLVADVPIVYLHQNVAVNSKVICSSKSDILLKDAPENDFEYWTFRDVNISNYTFEGTLQNKKPTYTESLNKTIFNAKLNLSADGNFGKLYIGGSVDEESAERGLALRGNSLTDEINVVFVGANGVFYNEDGAMSSGGPFLYCRPEIAGTTLRGNSELQVSVSFEWGEPDANGLVSVKIGIFFDGKLYNNEYYTLKDIDPAYLTRNINWHSGATGAVNSATSLAKAVNVTAATYDATITISHVDMYSENSGYGMDTLIDGQADENAPYYLGVVGTDLQNEPMTFDFTFDDAYSIDSIRLYKNSVAGGFPVDFTLSVYTLEGWKTVVTKTDYQSVAGWNEFNFAAIECSAVRLAVTECGKHENGTSYGFHLGEFEAWGVPSSAEIRTPYTIAEEATVIAYGKNDSALNDGTLIGNNGYRVLSDSQAELTKMQLMFDFPVTVDGIQLSAQEPGEFPSAFTIYAFTGSEWESIYSETSYTPSATQTTHEFVFDTAVTCSSIMVEVSSLCDIYDAGNIYGLQIQEIRLNGVSKDNGCALLGDGNADALLTEPEDMSAFRKALAESDSPGAIYEINRDGVNDCRDLVRMKRYFVNEERVVKTYDFTAMSLNVRGLTNTDGYLSQSQRAPYIATYIKESGADLVGLQEAGSSNLYDWHSKISEMVCEDNKYAAIKLGDDENYQNSSPYYAEEKIVSVSHGLIIFYNIERFELADSGAERITGYEIDTEERWYQWAKLTDRRSGETVFVTNTHFSNNTNTGEQDDLYNNEDRKVQATQLLNFWKENVKDEILVAIGDYNCYQASDPANILESDIYKEANVAFGDFGTLKLHIDHAFINPQQAEVKQLYFADDTFTYTDGTEQYYSDHLPLFVKLSYRK